MKKADVLQPVGRVLRSQGAGGELKVRLFADVKQEPPPGIFLRRSGKTKRFEVETLRRERGSVYLKLRGVDELNSAESLRGSEICLPVESLEPPGEDAYFAGQLVGCRVSAMSGEDLGVVTAVIPVGDTGLLVVERRGGEALIPLAADICREVKPEEGLIRVDPPDGLLDLNEI